MSRDLSMHHNYEVIANNKKEAAEYLMDLADYDCDFNGENGLEYLWEEAEGFESNAEYCLAVVTNIEDITPKEMIEKFIAMWMDKDSYYYEYDLGIIEEDDKLFVSLAYVSGY